MKDKQQSRPDCQDGASMVEFLIAAPLILTMGLGTLQAGMLYHSKTVLNYATFEAARVGATKHAMPDPMKNELGVRLAALYGGDGTEAKAGEAIVRSLAEIDSPVNLDGSIAPPTTITILNPTLEAFDLHGRASLEYKNRTAIPNSHLKHQDNSAHANTAAMSLADANLLKIKVTHGVELKVPYISKLILATMREVELNLGAADPIKLAYLESGRIPITSTATVRMQSEAWKESLELQSAPPPLPANTDPVLSLVPNDGNDPILLNPLPEDDGSDCNDHGLNSLLRNPANAPLQCEAGTVGPTNGTGGSEQTSSCG